MIKLTRAFLLAAAAAATFAPALVAQAQELKIGYVNSERLLREAAPAKAAQTRLEGEFGKREKDLADTRILNPHWATRKGADYDDLAALVANLDLVISVQTSVVDLAGALGIPCWALCDAAPQWRYGMRGPHMHFYESVRCFRQPEPGNWLSVMAQVHEALTDRLAMKVAAE